MISHEPWQFLPIPGHSETLCPPELQQSAVNLEEAHKVYVEWRGSVSIIPDTYPNERDAGSDGLWSFDAHGVRSRLVFNEISAV